MTDMDKQFNDLMQQIMEMLQKENAPVNVTMMALAVVACNVATNFDITKEDLLANLGKVYDEVVAMTPKAETSEA